MCFYVFVFVVDLIEYLYARAFFLMNVFSKSFFCAFVFVRLSSLYILVRNDTLNPCPKKSGSENQKSCLWQSIKIKVTSQWSSIALRIIVLWMRKRVQRLSKEVTCRY